jgi:hypothetical protein
MAQNPLGPGVSRYIDGRDRQFAGVVFETRRPPLDAELNLISLAQLEARAEEVRSRVPSGWLMNESNPENDFFTNSKYSNFFYFGRNQTGEIRSINWAVVNGWLVPVIGTETGSPPLAANDADTWNKILLNPPSASTGGNRLEFVFLEVWLARVDVDPAAPGIAPAKPQRGYIYKFGNVEGGFSFLPDELIDPNLNTETTRRVQIQYRIRVVSDINIAEYPEGFDSSSVFAQGQLSSPSGIPFVNMRQTLGDPGLWRAGNGDPSTFGTADGYVYAIPLCGVFRRNGSGFSDVGNLAGAFNRNSVAISRLNAIEFTNNITLSSDITDVATSFVLTSISNTVLQTINNYGEAYFRIDDEIIRVTNVIAVSPVSFTVVINRGQLQTTVRLHKIGTLLQPFTIRPDGLFADQITMTDIMDMRHSVADKFDYDGILRTNLTALLKGNLRSTWKRYGSTNSSGPVIFYGDRITDSSVFVGGLTHLDAPDGNRRIFSDCITTQRFNVPVTVPINSTSIDSPIQVTVAPFAVETDWASAPPIHTAGNRLSGGAYPTWWNGDQIAVRLSSFTAGLPAQDANQVRFVLPSEDPDAVIVRFEGMTTDPNGGVPGTTDPSATNTNLSTPVPTGNLIMKDGHGIGISINISGDLVITLQSGVIDSELQEFIDALQGNTDPAYAQKLVMHIEFTVLYGAGRGLSHKPSFIHTAHFHGSALNSSKVLLRDGPSDKNRMIPTYLCDSPYVQVGNDRNVAKTSEVMIDPGSKTVWAAPYRNVQVPSLLCRDGTKLNWYVTHPALPALIVYYGYYGCMPLRNSEPNPDPLNLFYRGSDSRYVEIPMDYLPRPGLHYIPIVSTSNAVFSSGINFFLMAKQGPNSNTSDYNQNLVSYPNAAGYYIVTQQIGEVYGANSGSLSIFGSKYTNSLITSANGGPFRGIKFPPYLAPARITGVYLRNGNAVIPVSSPFDDNRVFVGGSGTDINLLRDAFDGPTILLDVDTNGDVYFILNADVIDLTKAPLGTTFDNAYFLVECTLFGFDRGFLQTNGRIVCARLSGGGSTPVNINQFTDTTDDRIGIIVPAPLSAGASNNELTIYYSRTSYQGDVFGSQNAFSDDVYRRGPLTLGEASSIKNNPLGPVSTLTLPNRVGFEVLTSISFVTSLGTGRLSGSVPIPMLTPVDAPNNPEDFPGTRVDLNRRLSTNRVGYEDWVTQRFPITDVNRPPTEFGALSEIYDNDIHPEFSGCIANLPLGAYFRDKDFVGKTLYQSHSTNGAAAISIGTLTFIPFEASMAKAAEGKSTWEGVEFVCGNTSGTAGTGTEKIIKVDGTSNFSDVQVFKTARGGAAYSATGPWPGGIISSRFPKARHNTEVGSILTGTAYLVKSAPESLGEFEIHMGHELQMVIVTQAVPSYFRNTDIIHSASGMNEGYTAVDRYRLLGKPLEKLRELIDTSIVPVSKPLFQNQIFDNPLYFGSSDRSLTSQKQELLPVTSDGQTVFTMSLRPLDPIAVQLYLNGVKLKYGTDYNVSGITNTTVTYIVSDSNPALTTMDILEIWYIVY